MTKLDTLLVTKANSEAALAKMRSSFKTVHYYPDNAPIPPEVLQSSEMLYTGGGRFSSSIKSLEDMPGLKHIQMASAGAGGILLSDIFKQHLDRGGREITLAGASGTHVLSIPNYVVGTTIILFHQLQVQLLAARVSESLRG